jgi:hypothetical protein
VFVQIITQSFLQPYKILQDEINKFVQLLLQIRHKKTPPEKNKKHAVLFKVKRK